MLLLCLTFERFLVSLQFENPRLNFPGIEINFADLLKLRTLRNFSEFQESF